MTSARMSRPAPQRPALAVRLLASAAALLAAATFLAAQADFVRRHTPGITPQRFWRPQALQILAPGFGAATLAAGLAFVLHRRRAR
jgi:hypothetical protein